jgi:hypothetical protein
VDEERSLGARLETSKNGECKCCDSACRYHDHGSNEPQFPRSLQLVPSKQQERADHDCELERCGHHICDAHRLGLASRWSERQPGRAGYDPRCRDECVAKSSNYVDRAGWVVHDRDHPAELSETDGREEHPEEPVLRDVLIDDGEVDRRGTGRCDRDGEAKHPQRLDGTTCADADQHERDREDRHGKRSEPLAGVERILLVFRAFMGAQMGGVLVVISFGLPVMGARMDGVLVAASFRLRVMPGRSGEGAEDGRGRRQEESNRDEEAVRTDQPEDFSDWSGCGQTGAANRRARLRIRPMECSDTPQAEVDRFGLRCWPSQVEAHRRPTIRVALNPHFSCCGPLSEAA